MKRKFTAMLIAFAIIIGAIPAWAEDSSCDCDIEPIEVRFFAAESGAMSISPVIVLTGNGTYTGRVSKGNQHLRQLGLGNAGLLDSTVLFPVSHPESWRNAKVTFDKITINTDKTEVENTFGTQNLIQLVEIGGGTFHIVDALLISDKEDHLIGLPISSSIREFEITFTITDACACDFHTTDCPCPDPADCDCDIPDIDSDGSTVTTTSGAPESSRPTESTSITTPPTDFETLYTTSTPRRCPDCGEILADCDCDIPDIDPDGSTVTTTSAVTPATEPTTTIETTVYTPPTDFETLYTATSTEPTPPPETTTTLGTTTTRGERCLECNRNWRDCDCDIPDITAETSETSEPATTASTTTTSATTTTQPRLKGDVNNDEAITIIDALEILKYLAGLESVLDDCEDSFNAAKILPRDKDDSPENPTIMDVLEILKYLARLDSQIKHIIIGTDGWRWPVESRYTRVSQHYGCLHVSDCPNCVVCEVEGCEHDELEELEDDEDDEDRKKCENFTCEAGKCVITTFRSDDICKDCSQRQQERSRCHNGTDITGSGITGTNIYAMRSGVVRAIRTVDDSHGGYGNSLIIDHCEVYSTLYAHLHEIKVKVGQRVSRGDIIGTVGNTGRSTGPHLHLELRIGNSHYFINGGNGTAINMMQFFPENVLTR